MSGQLAGGESVLASAERPDSTTSNASNSNLASTKGEEAATTPGKESRSTSEASNVNFMSKFRDKDTRVLKNLNSTQFIEVWNNYDKDGKYPPVATERRRARCVLAATPAPLSTPASSPSKSL